MLFGEWITSHPSPTNEISSAEEPHVTSYQMET